MLSFRDLLVDQAPGIMAPEPKLPKLEDRSEKCR